MPDGQVSWFRLPWLFPSMHLPSHSENVASYLQRTKRSQIHGFQQKVGGPTPEVKILSIFSLAVMHILKQKSTQVRKCYHTPASFLALENILTSDLLNDANALKAQLHVGCQWA